MIYQILIRLFSPLIWLIIFIESIKKQGGGNFIRQRLGLDYPRLPQVSQRIWFHCASVGEVKAAEPLIRALESKYHILVTTNTPTGKQLINSLFQDRVEHCYLPLDWPFAIRHFLNHCQPTDAWILETEIWPNLYKICAQQNIELKILNARLSHKTLKSPNWLKKSYRQSLQVVTQILARSQTEAERFMVLGVKPNKIQVLGNLKFAQMTSKSHAPRPISQAYVLLASSHQDEELHISLLWKKLNRPELLIIVPRHPNRSKRIQKQLKPHFPTLKVASQNQQPTPETSLFLDDRLGKLMPLFEHAQVVIMGGSFVPNGGHNILEPALYQKAIITGSDMSDFADETNLLLHHKGMMQCQNYSDLTLTLQTLLNDPEQCQTLGQNAFNAMRSQQNMLQRYLDHLV